MGREVKRVPLDFDWPIGHVWPGYYLGLCGLMDDDCDGCRRFAELANVPITSYGCPEVKIDPPRGEGYQIWEDVTEGSPVSPAFSTPEELAKWMVENDTSITKDATLEQWIVFINGSGWAPSMIGGPGGLRSGVGSVETAPNSEPDTGGITELWVRK